MTTPLLTPETQQFIIQILWWLVGSLAVIIVFFGSIILFGGKYVAGKALARIDKLEDAGIKIGNDLIVGLQGVREALTGHHLDLSGRIEKTNTNIALHKQTLDGIKERTEKELPELFKRVHKVEKDIERVVIIKDGQ